MKKAIKRVEGTIERRGDELLPPPGTMLYVWRLDEERGEFVSKSVNYEEAVRVRVQLMLDGWGVVKARARRALLSPFMSKQKRLVLEALDLKVVVDRKEVMIRGFLPVGSPSFLPAFHEAKAV